MKLFEEPNIQVAVVIDKARAWETPQRQASTIAQREGRQSSYKRQNSVNMVGDRESKTPSGFGTDKYYACGKVGHFARDKVCPARGMCKVW